MVGLSGKDDGVGGVRVGGYRVWGVWGWGRVWSW